MKNTGLIYQNSFTKIIFIDHVSRLIGQNDETTKMRHKCAKKIDKPPSAESAHHWTYEPTRQMTCRAQKHTLDRFVCHVKETDATFYTN